MMNDNNDDSTLTFTMHPVVFCLAVSWMLGTFLVGNLVVITSMVNWIRG